MHTNSELCFSIAPKVLALNLFSFKGVLDKQIRVTGKNGRTNVLQLRGLIYYGGNHFTSRLVTNKGKVWFHDRITTGNSVILQGHMRNIKEMLCCDRKK